MSTTKRELLKKQKKVDRRKANSRSRHIQSNKSTKRYRLDLLIGDQWKKDFARFSNRDQILGHKITTERLRKKGDEIVEGIVVDTLTGDVVARVRPSKPKKPEVSEKVVVDDGDAVVQLIDNK